MPQPIFDPLNFHEYAPDEMVTRSAEFLAELRQRRTVRDFSSRAVSKQVIVDCITAAGTAPSGANLQPWHFVVVTDPALKSRIRQAAEVEEREFYTHRAPKEWLEALAALGTDEHKPFLETAPCLIAVFAQAYAVTEDNRAIKHYYVSESVGIATGFLIAALHHAGLATLTHTPSPMNFLNELLHRPKSDRPFLLLVVGYPASDAKVPRIDKKPFEEFVTLR